MFFSRLLDQLRRGGRTNPRRRALCRLGVEALEDRTVPVLSVTPASSADALVASLVGSGLSFSNAQLFPAQQGFSSAGTFTGGTGILGFESGVVLSSGTIQNVVGPNDESGATGVNNAPGDAQLNQLSGSTTFDATVLEFDIVPTGNILTFQYVFASEEYPEFVGQFNDVFGFFVNGTNVALIPGTTTPVAINTVNGGSNSPFFIDNTSGARDTEMDGLTTVLTLRADVIPGQTNHIRLAIADEGDEVLDSNVFIQSGSVTSVTGPPVGTGGPSVPGARSPNEAYVTALYRDVLNRSPDAAGFNFWVSGLNSGTFNRDVVATEFLISGERRGIVVDEFYRQLLGRAADAPGRAFWVTALLQGMGEAQVVVEFVTSVEFTTRFGQDNRTFVTNLYQRVLLRSPGGISKAELDFQTLVLDQRFLTREEMATSFLVSPEASFQAILGYYQEFLRRRPSAVELANWVNILQSGGETPISAAAEFLAGPEYLAIVQPRSS